MAHTCPNCGCTCHCRGDIDDINFGERLDCDCCKEKMGDFDCDELDDSYDEDQWHGEA